MGSHVEVWGDTFTKVQTIRNRNIMHFNLDLTDGWMDRDGYFQYQFLSVNLNPY